MSWEETYINLAIEFDATLSDRPNDVNHLKEALYTIVDITSDTSSTNPSLPALGTKAVIRLFTPMNLLHGRAKLFYIYDLQRNKMVKKINDFTVDYFGDLTKFVNNLDWPDGCIPFYWDQLSQAGGTDTTDWNVCIS